MQIKIYLNSKLWYSFKYNYVEKLYLFLILILCKLTFVLYNHG